MRKKATFIRFEEQKPVEVRIRDTLDWFIVMTENRE
jgi:hypothetical protein